MLQILKNVRDERSVSNCTGTQSTDPESVWYGTVLEDQSTQNTGTVLN
ncbi:hypothetical protein HanIR_Chr13g0644071 [Helianthus annuus]|nr:hypothetical protein HanIR_Chr13g0644071 [Helianthus annuus]